MEDRFKNLRAWCVDNGYGHISLEACMELDAMSSLDRQGVPYAVFKEFRVFMDGMAQLLGPPD